MSARQGSGGSPPVDSETRANAAERTVQVLKKKVFDLYNGDGSSLHKQLETARRREDETRRKRDLFEMRATELKRYSETLEAEVARRIEASKVILDNVIFGFLVVGRDLIVEPEATRSCQRLLEGAQVSGEPLASLLCSTDRARQEFVLGADQVFEDILPEEVSLGQMRTKFEMKSGRILLVEGRVLREKSGDVGRILFTISDITALEAPTRETNHNRALVGVLRQKGSFRAFLLEAQKQLSDAAHAITDSTEAVQAAVRQIFHTIKGNSASYALTDITELVHAIEDAPTLTAGHVAQIESALRTFVESNKEVLGLSYDRLDEGAYEVSSDQLDKLHRLIAALPGADASGLKRWSAHLRQRPVAQLVGPVEDFSRRLAERLGKSGRFELVGGELNVDAEVFQPVLQVVPHLLRNAIDHGIEPPFLRGAKPREAAVRLTALEQSGALVLRVEDDGAGINVDVLMARALSLGIITEARASTISEAEKLDLVFVDGLSTAEITTSISGRGVGMSAVKAAVESLGGSVEIRSVKTVGTTVTLTVPRPAEGVGHAGRRVEPCP